MKLLGTLLLLFFAFSAEAQTPVSTSVQQEITFRLLNIAIVEKTTALPQGQAGNTSAAVKVFSSEKWIVNKKNYNDTEKFFRAFFRRHKGAKQLDESLASTQLYTLSKP